MVFSGTGGCFDFSSTILGGGGDADGLPFGLLLTTLISGGLTNNGLGTREMVMLEQTLAHIYTTRRTL